MIDLMNCCARCGVDIDDYRAVAREAAELKRALSLAYKRIAAYAAQENHRGRAAQEALRAALDAGLRAFAGHAEDMRIEHQAVIAAERDWLLEHATPEVREAYDHMVAQIMTGPGAQDAE